jgi:hypothetical protein
VLPAGLGVVDGNELPYLPEALKKKQENQDNWLTRDPEIKCYLPGVPRATYMPLPFQIFQGEGSFFISYEYAGAVRNVYLKDLGPAAIDSWMASRWSLRRYVRIEVPASTTSRGSIAPATTTPNR